MIAVARFKALRTIEAGELLAYDKETDSVYPVRIERFATGKHHWVRRYKLRKTKYSKKIFKKREHLALVPEYEQFHNAEAMSIALHDSQAGEVIQVLLYRSDILPTPLDIRRSQA